MTNKICKLAHLQKNPNTIRLPEEDRGRENFTMTAWVNLPRAAPISRHIYPLCTEALDSTYISNVDIKILATKPGNSRHLQRKSTLVFDIFNVQSITFILM